MKRSYGQYCAIAKALDVVGGRWTLLVVRELMGGPRRFGDLLDGLPGIGTNLLSERLKELQEAGAIEKRVLPPPAGSTVYELSARGRMLGGVALAMAWWGYELLDSPKKGEDFRVHWFMVIGKAASRPEVLGDSSLVCEMRTSESDVSYFRADKEGFHITQGPAIDPDISLSGSPREFIDLFTGQVAPEKALANGISLDGDMESLHKALEVFGLLQLSAAPG